MSDDLRNLFQHAHEFGIGGKELMDLVEAVQDGRLTMQEMEKTPVTDYNPKDPDLMDWGPKRAARFGLGQ